MADDVKVLRECEAQSLKDAKSLGETHPAYATLHKGMAIICRRLADSIEREEAEFSFTHEQINERDQVIAEQAWNAAIEACVLRATSTTFGVDEKSILIVEALVEDLAALRRGPAS